MLSVGMRLLLLRNMGALAKPSCKEIAITEDWECDRQFKCERHHKTIQY
ncbi:MAG: hypothetical protein F6K09_25455 [Merismopedia sp. SIO2A8]|nr:hypothetical protein [Merismopedia sp. SIO2A8]